MAEQSFEEEKKGVLATAVAFDRLLVFNPNELDREMIPSFAAQSFMYTRWMWLSNSPQVESGTTAPASTAFFRFFLSFPAENWFAKNEIEKKVS